MQTPFQLYDRFHLSIILDNIGNVKSNLINLLKNFSLKPKELPKVDFKKVCSTRTIPSSSKVKFLLFEPATNPGSTVFFSNFTDGWVTAVRSYARLSARNAFHLGFTADDAEGSSAYFFYFFYLEKGQMRERAVHAIKEDKWVFFTDNAPLAIEDISNYSKKRIKDRVNNEIIIAYLKKAGFDLTNNEFYKSAKPAILFTN